MSDSGGIPEIQCTHPDGRPRTRLEMDQWLRKEVPKVHWLRIHACRTLGLPKQISWDMKEIVLRHWILDELIRRQRNIGDLLGVNATASNDEVELRQFEQRLAALIQAGQAVQPQHAEGIDMNGYTPPPPPMGGAPQQVAQPAYQPGPPAPQSGPPGVPMGPPGYQAGPPGPPQPPQQQYPQQQYQPPGPPGGYAQPPAGVPMAPPAAAPARRGRPPRAEAAQGAPPQAAPVPPMAPGVPQAPQGFAPAGFQPQGAPGFSPPAPAPAYQTAPQPVPMQAPMQQAPIVDLSSVLTKLDQVLNIEQSTAARFAALEKRIEVLSMINTTLCRAMYQMGGTPDAETFLKELQEVAAKAAAAAQQNPPR